MNAPNVDDGNGGSPRYIGAAEAPEQEKWGKIAMKCSLIAKKLLVVKVSRTKRTEIVSQVCTCKSKQK